MNTRPSIMPVVLIAMAAVTATAVEFTGIGMLAARPVPLAGQTAVALPTVVVTAPRAALAQGDALELPRMVIKGHRETRSAQSEPTRPAI